MAHEHFLAAFAQAQGVESVDVLLDEEYERYRFQIENRKRGAALAKLLRTHLGDLEDKRILDVGCAYAGCAIEFARAGALVTGVEFSPKWLALAEENCRDDVDVELIHGDASARTLLHKLAGRQFDVIVINDVLEHIYDTAGLLHNCNKLLSQDGSIYFEVPNGLATQTVLSEGHKHVFGVSLLPPDYWAPHVSAPFSIYYRRWPYYQALFAESGFSVWRWLTEKLETNDTALRSQLQKDIERIQRCSRQLPDQPQFAAMRDALDAYLWEIANDIATLAFDELYFKYRAQFWQGLLRRSDVRTKAEPIHLRRAPLVQRLRSTAGFSWLVRRGRWVKSRRR